MIELRGECGDSVALPGEVVTTGHERSKTVFNFSLPNLWGTQRHLRCIKVDSDGGSSSGDQRLRRRSLPPSEFDNQNRRLKAESSEKGEEEGIEEFREKIMSDLRNVADQMTESIFRKQVLGDGDGEEEKRWEEEKKKEREVSPPEAPGTAAEVRPWNLRKRRAACKAPITGTDGNQYNNYKGFGIEERKRVNPSTLGKEWANSTMRERTKLHYTLSKKEIEEDYMKMTGHRPPRRPKKRPKTIQKQMDLLNPASYFTEITEDLYKVSDQAKNGKRC